MKSIVTIDGIDYNFKLNDPVDLTIPFLNNASGPNCFHAPKFATSPLVSGNFIGSRDAGSPVNFYDVKINPHGNGTHTECVGHISDEKIYIKDVNPIGLHFSQLISVTPTKKENGDLVITKKHFEDIDFTQNIKCLLLRTLPNKEEKLTKNYSNTNPPYLESNAIEFINSLAIDHFILDLPSIDKELDGGAMLSHKTFWSYNEVIDKKKTITEMVFIPNKVKDGLFLCSINAIPFELDAAPSKVLIYPLKKEHE
jgi:kynurenine formamidase